MLPRGMRGGGFGCDGIYPRVKPGAEMLPRKMRGKGFWVITHIHG